ncbi:MAG: hypothetical protein ACK44O_14575 [Novosphingobium sp.]
MSPAVLITGAGKRIGAVLARSVADAGWPGVIHAHHSPDAAHALAATLPSAEVVQCDLLDGEAALAMVAKQGEVCDLIIRFLKVGPMSMHCTHSRLPPLKTM